MLGIYDGEKEGDLDLVPKEVVEVVQMGTALLYGLLSWQEFFLVMGVKRVGSMQDRQIPPFVVVTVS